MGKIESNKKQDPVFEESLSLVVKDLAEVSLPYDDQRINFLYDRSLETNSETR